MDPTPAVALRGISKRYGTCAANDDVSLVVAERSVHALVGENGAGKSTLMKVLYGLLAPDRGTIEIGGRAVRLARPADAIAHGLGMVHQHFMLVGPLTVAENVLLGSEPGGPLAPFHRGSAERAVREISGRTGLVVDPAARVESLPVGLQQRVEILKALHRGARVLILDEPTAVLTPQEVDDLFVVLRRLREAGVAIVLITHKLAEVQALADTVTVMRGGRVVGGGPVAEMPAARIAELMVGRVLAPLATRRETSPVVPLIEVAKLEVADDRGLPAVREVSFTVRGGEIVGLAGIEGNGQHELLEAIAGLRRPLRGRVRIGGREMRGADPAAHRRAGLAHIPSDRLHRGMVAAMSVAENLALGRQDEPGIVAHPLAWGGRGFRERARATLTAFDVRPDDPGLPAGRLSGGNQQKLVAARELSRRCPAILAAHPTRGVDLGAIDFLHRRLLAERDAGRGILLVSSELSELLALADRILVIEGGRIVHETTPAWTDERTLGLHMAGRGGEAGR